MSLVLPDGPVSLRNATVPACLIGGAGDLVRLDLALAGGKLVAPAPGMAEVDLKGAMVLPAFVDMHTHLDKGQIWGRSPNPDGSFMGALGAAGADREMYWSAEDVRRRMDFALRGAYAHGTCAIRTHLDSIPPQDAISWPLFAEIRAEWAGRIDLQAASLAGCDMVLDPAFDVLADRVAAHNGTLGLFTFPMPDMPARLRRFFQLAADRGLQTDFHADETMDPAVNTLAQIAEAALETGFQGRVVAGHCCSLSTMPEVEALRTLDLCAKAGIGIVSLPMCNLYLQDRHPARTPRNRGITLVHEARARGIPVAFASDNSRDPFYAYGDLDMVEVLREATRIAHLDHSATDWVQSVLTTPAMLCGFPAPSLTPGAPADLVIFRARSWTEFFSRPQADRTVLRAGRPIDTALPDYAELDDLMRTA
ncbi:cytosine deaminase [Rhodobacter sp. SY28-1]|uniref:cytosine deaminase n=1 Tax=Rhodobacter sp. SY28-1 TaxID=2562317 RepID=UPI0010C1509D|nr:cytosine deaminase [Rhodobacter sp. SY28-1]